MSQVVEHLPCKHEALSSNPSTAEKKKKEKMRISHTWEILRKKITQNWLEFELKWHFQLNKERRAWERQIMGRIPGKAQ
jgi:hypothetical protein